MTAAVPRLTVYWRPGCGYCRRLRRALARAGVGYAAIDIWENPDARAFVRSVADGHETVPTVRLDAKVLVNPRPRDLLTLIGDQAPELLGTDSSRFRLARWWSTK